MAIELVEILRRSKQGVTQPFISRADDDQIYFVKGKGAPRESQVFEWLAGCLGRRLGLPIPPFELVNVSDELLQLLPDPWRLELGSGLAFGSQERRVNELTYSGIDEVPEELQKDVFLFDLWIKNGDRTLFERGGNPNLFWDPGAQELVVIDHNCAFDSDVDIGYLLKNHVFRDYACQMMGDFYARDYYSPRLEAVLEGWDQITGAIPENWFYADDEMTQSLNFDLEEIFDSLTRFRKDEFWVW